MEQTIGNIDSSLNTVLVTVLTNRSSYKDKASRNIPGLLRSLPVTKDQVEYSVLCGRISSGIFITWTTLIFVLSFHVMLLSN